MTQHPPSIANVIDLDFCIGCGACAALDGEFRLGETAAGFRKVVERPRDKHLLAAASKVCPFADAPDEDELSARLFPLAPQQDAALGRYIDLYAGYSVEFRASAGSGGVTRWLLSELLARRAIDFVVTVDRKLGHEGGDLFHVGIHDSRASFLDHCSTSAYFPISLDEALGSIRRQPGRFAVTALPCFARALRALAAVDEEIGARLSIITGTVCGSLKGRRYAEYLSHQMGLDPKQLGRINFRGKQLSRSAHEKCVEVWSEGNASDMPDAVARVQDLDGTDYGAGYFKPKACDYCDDVFAEVADVSFGDAWISPYREDPQGSNVIVVRNAAIARILRDGIASGALRLDKLTAEQARLTQNSGLRHRRQGLAVRLWLAAILGAWTPRKRVEPGRGRFAFNISQIIRIAIRRLTTSPALSPENRLFPLLMRPFVAVHARLRWHATRPQLSGLGEFPATQAGDPSCACAGAEQAPFLPSTKEGNR